VTSYACRVPADCEEGFRRTCTAEGDCSAGTSCCASGAAIRISVVAREHEPGDQQCQTSCGEEDAPIACSRHADCPGTQMCCRHMEPVVAPDNPVLVDLVLRGTSCADDCSMTEAVPICVETSDCGQDERCSPVLLAPGMGRCL
jgi:hypothetical protein